MVVCTFWVWAEVEFIFHRIQREKSSWTEFGIEEIFFFGNLYDDDDDDDGENSCVQFCFQTVKQSRKKWEREREKAK